MKKTILDYPELAKEWHPILNGNLMPKNVTNRSDKKIWWMCDKNHEWETSPSKRTRINKTGCPYCANQKVCKDNCLATTHLELVKEWHPTLNGILTPNDVIAGTNKKVWWQCVKNHEWQASINNRTSANKTNCPYCANHKACNDNCLSILYPNIAKEWHPTKNIILTPSSIIAGSNKRIWWKCDKNHEWEATCNSRTGKTKNGCPYCSNHKVCIDNCLATTHPESAKEWHPTLNGKLTPNDIVAGSNKKAWWICSKNHKWEVKCSKKTGCPYCTNQKVCIDNCLATTHTKLAKEWHPTLNGKLTPNDVIAGTNKKIWWTCDKKHEWITSCLKRTCQNRGCPYCANQKVCKDNSLATLFPEIAREFHPSLNRNLTPNDIIAGSEKKFWWFCCKNHEWQASCGSRTGKYKTGCPVCNESKGEKEIAKILNKLNIKYKREYRFNSCKNIRTLPFDFILINNTEKAKVIEYHGIQHYEPSNFGSFKNCKNSMFKGIQYRDKIKKDFCKFANIPLLEISYKDYDNIEEIIKKFLLI